MTKLLIGSGVLLLVCGCFTRRAKEAESFLLLSSPQDKVAILTVLPAAGDTAGIYVSSIFVNSFTAAKRQSMAFTYTFDGRSGKCTTRNDFIDSLMQFPQPHFPVLLAPAKRDSTHAFRFFLGRRKAMMETGPPIASATQYAIGYPKQQTFDTRAGGGLFQINGIVPIGATLNSFEGHTTDQPSVFSLHCLDNAAGLFQGDQSWYWIDCALDGAVYHVFFAADRSNRVTVHYSTFPDAFEVNLQREAAAAQPVITIGRDEEKIRIRPLAAAANSPKNTFRIDAVELIKNGSAVGNGILYQL